MTVRTPGLRERLRPLGRSFFGLLAGFCLILVLWVVVYALLDGIWRSSFDAHDNPASIGVVIALVCATTLISLAGGLLAVRLARRLAIAHALVLAAMVAATNWSLSQNIGGAAPSWFAPTHSALPAIAILLAGWRESRRFRASG